MKMNTMNLDALNRAEGFCQLCLWQEAWNATEELQKCDKAHPEVAALRLRIVIKLAKWEVGEEVANMVSESPRIEFRRSAAQYFLGRAREIYLDGDRSEARFQFQKAINAWPGIDREFTERDRVELGPEEEY